MLHYSSVFTTGSAKNASCGVASCSCQLRVRVTNRLKKDISNPRQGKIIS